MLESPNRKTLLLTRLREESHASASRLRRRGWSVVCAPLLSLEALPAPDLVEQLGRVSALVVTSKSALRTLRHTFARTPTLSPLHSAKTRALSVYAVGTQSAALARRMGFASVRTAQGTLASLIEEIRQHLPQQARLLYLCGQDRRGNLVESLRKKGYAVDKSVLYKAVSVQTLPLSASNLLSVPSSLYASMFYSPRTADIFATLYAHAFGEPSMLRARLLFFCLASSIGVRLRQSFPQARIVCAAAPSEASLLQSLDKSLDEVAT